MLACVFMLYVLVTVSLGGDQASAASAASPKEVIVLRRKIALEPSPSAVAQSPETPKKPVSVPRETRTTVK